MRATASLRFRHGYVRFLNLPVVKIDDATFYRQHPASTSSNDANKDLFPNLSFTLDSDATDRKHWAIIGPSNAGKSTFLEILQGQHICIPPLARSYPYLSSEELRSKDAWLSHPSRALKYVGFSVRERGLTGIGTHLSARYESHREVTDFSVLDYLKGDTQLNADTVNQNGRPTDASIQQVVTDLKLRDLLDMPATNLSNGQTRRARIAKALLDRPEVLLLDEPFMGLDPPTTIAMNPLLRGLAQAAAPRIVLSLRPQDPIPDWITHVAFLGESLRVTHAGPRYEVEDQVRDIHRRDLDRKSRNRLPQRGKQASPMKEFGRTLTDFGVMPRLVDLSPEERHEAQQAWIAFQSGKLTQEVLEGLKPFRDDAEKLHGNEHSYRWYRRAARGATPDLIGEPVLKMEGVRVKYGDKVVLGNWDKQLVLGDEVKYYRPRRFDVDEDYVKEGKSGLHWTVKRGSRWAVTGPNGSGKTTLLAMILSDHPQAYSQPVQIFGRARLPTLGEPGISLFDIQKRIGHSSPEVHAYFPRHLSVRQTLESAWADAPASRPTLDSEKDRRVSACLRWFQGELNPALGMDPDLHEEMLKEGKRLTRSSAKPTSPEVYRQKRQEWFYDRLLDREERLDWADSMLFSEMTFTGQRVALFLRAIIARPDIIILDEALSGLDDLVREKCFVFLEWGETRWLTPVRGPLLSLKVGSQMRAMERSPVAMALYGCDIKEGLTSDQALIVVSHVQEEIPSCTTDFLFLPEAATGDPCRLGRVAPMPLKDDESAWAAIWDLPGSPAMAKILGKRGWKLGRKRGAGSLPNRKGWPKGKPRLHRLKGQPKVKDGPAAAKAVEQQ